MKSKENKTASDQKKLESLEMIKKEFKETFTIEAKEKSKLVKEGKKLETKKEDTKITDLEVQKDKLVAQLNDGRELSIPIAWFAK